MQVPTSPFNSPVNFTLTSVLYLPEPINAAPRTWFLVDDKKSCSRHPYQDRALKSPLLLHGKESNTHLLSQHSAVIIRLLFIKI